MKVNRDLMKIIRTGKAIDKHTYRKENKAGMIVAICIGIGMSMIILGLIMKGVG